MGGQQCKEATTTASAASIRYPTRCHSRNNHRTDDLSFANISLDQNSHNDAFQARTDSSFDSQQSNQHQVANSAASEEVNPYTDLKLLRPIVEQILEAHKSRGAVSSKHTHDIILAAFIEQINQCRNPLIALEIILALNRLIKTRLLHSTWDYILDICDHIVSTFAMSAPQTERDILIPENPFPKQIHDLLTEIEHLSDSHQLTSSAKHKLFDVIEKCSPFRPEESIIRLIRYRSEAIVPKNEFWVKELCNLLDTYFVSTKAISIRRICLNMLETVILSNRTVKTQTNICIFEETLVDNVVLQYLKDVDQDSAGDIRCVAVDILLEVAEFCTNPRRCSALFDLIKKIMDRPFQGKTTSGLDSDEENENREEMCDVKAAVNGLIVIFAKKLFAAPSSSAAISYKLLIHHLTAHYENGLNGVASSEIRHLILESLLSLRANALQQIGFNHDGVTKYSTQVKCSHTDCDNSITESNSGSHHTSGNVTPLNTSFNSADSSSSLTSISLNKLFNCLILALKEEKDWTIMKLILELLPNLLQNKAAVYLTETHNVANALCETLISLINDRSKNLLNYYKTNQTLCKSEFHGLIYPNLVSLIGYNDHLEMKLKRGLVMCLENGFTTQPLICIPALMLCIAEMHDIMVKTIPDVVLSLSKLSPTVNLAIPKLEFLSHLTLWPQVYYSFTSDQFMSIFAILLPYTNPFKFNDYVVTMAHKVIAMWLLQCRLPNRKHLVEFIIKNLEANVLRPLEENAREDDRKRSSSLSVDKRSSEIARLPGTPRIPVSPLPHTVDLPSSPSSNQPSPSVFSFNSLDNQQHSGTNASGGNKQQLHSVSNQSHEAFHTELIESCMDFLSKYTFGSYSSVPPKYPITDFILDRKQCCSWLVGQKIITITTSGCNARVSQDGLCEECNKICKSVDNIIGCSTNDEVAHYMSSGSQQQPHHTQLYRSESETSADLQSSQIGRKRHRSYQHSASSNHNKPESRAFDDSNLRLTSNSSRSATLRDQCCSCWCQGWAEILIQAPSGNTSWITRIQNRLSQPSFATECSLPDLTSIYNQKDTYEEKKPILESNVRDFRKSGNFDVRSFSTPPSVFKRSSSSPEMEKNEVFDEVPNDKEAEYLNQESLENHCKRSDLDSPLETSNLGLHDPPSIVTYARSSSLGCMSPTKPSVKSIERKNSFSKTKLKLDLNSTPNSNNLELSCNPSLSPLKPSSPNIACKTPQKTPSKLDNIPEQGGHSGHRERVHTISVMSPAQKGNLKRLPLFQKSTGTVPRSSGLSPAFVFLQFFYNTSTNAGEKPILLPRNDPTIAATFNVIDFTLPYETHKIGVVYIGPGQIEDCVTIMSNTAGSLRYTAFLKGLGNLIRLSSVKPEQIYLGGLTTDGSDGQFAFYWEDRLTQVIFHVATLIPNKSTDPQRNNKKKHIGNDYVVIVYNDSGEDFSLTTLKGRGQFTYVCIVITPTDYQTNRVHFQTIPEVSDLIGHKYPVMVSDTVLPHFVRQLSIQANLACLVYKWRCTNPSSPYTSNSVERLRKIKSLRQKALKLNANEYNINANSQGYKLPPFNDYAAAESEKFGTNQPTHFAFPDDFTNYV